MLIGYVSDENYVALADVLVEFQRDSRTQAIVRSPLSPPFNHTGQRVQRINRAPHASTNPASSTTERNLPMVKPYAGRAKRDLTKT